MEVLGLSTGVRECTSERIIEQIVDMPLLWGRDRPRGEARSSEHVQQWFVEHVVDVLVTQIMEVFIDVVKVGQMVHFAAPQVFSSQCC